MDDTQIHTSFNPRESKSLCAGVWRLEHCIMEIRTWMAINQLVLSDGKTEFIVFTSSYFNEQVEVLQPKILIGEKTILPTETVKSLGVIFDSCMTMQPCVNQIVKAAYFKGCLLQVSICCKD